MTHVFSLKIVNQTKCVCEEIRPKSAHQQAYEAKPTRFGQGSAASIAQQNWQQVVRWFQTILTQDRTFSIGSRSPNDRTAEDENVLKQDRDNNSSGEITAELVRVAAELEDVCMELNWWAEYR